MWTALSVKSVLCVYTYDGSTASSQAMGVSQALIPFLFTVISGIANSTSVVGLETLSSHQKSGMGQVLYKESLWAFVTLLVFLTVDGQTGCRLDLTQGPYKCGSSDYLVLLSAATE